MMPSNHLIFCRPLLLLPSIFPSIRVFSKESTLRIGWPKDWSFGFSVSPSSEYSGLTFFRMDWFDPLAVQGTLKSLLQHHSSKPSILWCSAFFMVQLSHPYMTTGKTIALTRWTFVGKVMYLLFNMLSRLVITFLPRSKRLNLMAAVYSVLSSSVCTQSLQLCPTLCDPMDCPLSRGILQARILEWVTMPFSRGSPWPRDWTHISWVSCIAGGLFTHWANWEAPLYHLDHPDELRTQNMH